MSTQQPRRSPRKHKRKTEAKKAAKQVEPSLPQIKWTADEGALTWALIASWRSRRTVLFSLEKTTKTRRVSIRPSGFYFDPTDRDFQNTSGDSKIAVYKRIGGVILPDLFAVSPNALAKRVKCSQHEDDPETQNNGEDNVHQFLACYIGAAGPDHDTTPKARNIWEKITKDFMYFPALHKFLAARSNIIPPVITTGVGPEGRKVVHLQPPTQRRQVAPLPGGMIYHALSRELWHDVSIALARAAALICHLGAKPFRAWKIIYNIELCAPHFRPPAHGAQMTAEILRPHEHRPSVAIGTWAMPGYRAHAPPPFWGAHSPTRGKERSSLPGHLHQRPRAVGAANRRRQAARRATQHKNMIHLCCVVGRIVDLAASASFEPVVRPSVGLVSTLRRDPVGDKEDEQRWSILKNCCKAAKKARVKLIVLSRKRED
ncbi:hypothetical protein B0H13DRAFT_1850763 [Mycena leptocephala]|nr:hypothetical protein B0H13DRAFT_1850763 [Mycena leptocephala]